MAKGWLSKGSARGGLTKGAPRQAHWTTVWPTEWRIVNQKKNHTVSRKERDAAAAAAAVAVEAAEAADDDARSRSAAVAVCGGNC